MLKVFEEGVVMTRQLEAVPRGDFSPLFGTRPYRGHPFLLNNGPGLQPWIRKIKAGFTPAFLFKIQGCYDQADRGCASGGLQSPFLFVPLSGAHRFFLIMAQDFSPGLQYNWLRVLWPLRATGEQRCLGILLCRHCAALCPDRCSPGLWPWSKCRGSQRVCCVPGRPGGGPV